MRCLIFGDVHGNLPALELLFKKEKSSYDIMICHGDVVNYGPWSNECVTLMHEKGVHCLRGNHEDYFIARNYPGSHPVVKAFFEKCLPTFSAFSRIENYGDTLPVGSYIIRHTVLNRYIFADTDLAQETLNGSYIIGHSHQQFRRRTSRFDLVNTGSLGQNRSLINVANYIVYDTETEYISMKYFIFDIDLVLNEMIAKNYSNICLDYYRSKKRA